MIAGTSSVGAEELTPAQRQQRREKIARMSESERQRLRQNFETFQKLSDEQKERLRTIDREIKADDHNPDNLRKTMTVYLEWLDTLSFGEREAIRDESDPGKREAIVRETLKDQQRREGFLNSRRFALNGPDLDAVVQVVEGELRSQVIRSPHQFDRLPSEPGLRRHIAVLELAFAPQLSDGTPQTPLRRTPELVDAMMEKISNPDQKKWAGEGGPVERTGKIFGLVMGGIWAEYERDKPGENELAEFLAGLDATKQQELMRFQGEWQDRHLARMYMNAHPEKYPPMPQFDKWFGFGPPGWRNDPGRNRRGMRPRGKPEGAEEAPKERPFDRLKKNRESPPAT
jgi:hypothetical protein